MQPPAPERVPLAHTYADQAAVMHARYPNATEDEVQSAPGVPQELLFIKEQLNEEKAKRAQAEEAAVRAHAAAESGGGGSSAMVQALKMSHAAEVSRLKQELAAVREAGGPQASRTEGSSAGAEAELQVSQAALQAERAVRTAAQAELAQVKAELAAIKATSGSNKT